MNTPPPPGSPPGWRERLTHVVYRGLVWGDRRVPAGVRSVLGVLLMLGGVFWFLPILGLWMVPLGLAFIALDIPWTRRRLREWMRRHSRERREERRP